MAAEKKLPTGFRAIAAKELEFDASDKAVRDTGDVFRRADREIDDLIRPDVQAVKAAARKIREMAAQKFGNDNADGACDTANILAEAMESAYTRMADRRGNVALMRITLNRNGRAGDLVRAVVIPDGGDTISLPSAQYGLTLSGMDSVTVSPTTIPGLFGLSETNNGTTLQSIVGFGNLPPGIPPSALRKLNETSLNTQTVSAPNEPSPQRTAGIPLPKPSLLPAA